MAPTLRRTADNSFEAFLLVVAAINGASVLIGGPRPNSVDALLHPWLVTVWGVMLLTGGVSALLGFFWNGRLTTAYTLEQVGLILAGGATMVYALAVVAAAPRAGAFAAGISAAFSLACWSRALSIRRLILDHVAAGR